jgi:hypothetical protein
MRATELFREGNVALKESLFVQAAAKYREALILWQHPGIHYNLALALLNLDQPVEVMHHLEEAVRYGALPLDSDKFEHAQRYRALTERQLSRYEISCETPGAQVSLDGQPLFTGPGKREGLLRVGKHAVTAEKSGFVTAQQSPIFTPGDKTTLKLKLYTADELTQYKRRWNASMPYGVLAGGLVLAGLGGVLHWQAASQYAAFDRDITSCSEDNNNLGCRPTPTISEKRGLGTALQGAAFVGYAIGGGVAVAGVVLAVLNRAQAVRVNPESASKVSVVPVAGPNQAGLVALGRF